MWNSAAEADQWIKQWREERARLEAAERRRAQEIQEMKQFAARQMARLEEERRQEAARQERERYLAAARAARTRELARQKEEELELANGPIARDFMLTPKETVMRASVYEGRCQQQLRDQACHYMDQIERHERWKSFSEMNFIPRVAFPLVMLWAARRAARRFR